MEKPLGLSTADRTLLGITTRPSADDTNDPLLWVLRPRNEGAIVRVSGDRTPVTRSSNLEPAALSNPSVQILRSLDDRSLVQVASEGQERAGTITVTIITTDN